MKIVSRKTNPKVFRQKQHEDATINGNSWSPNTAEFRLVIDDRVIVMNMTVDEMQELKDLLSNRIEDVKAFYSKR